MPRILPIVWPTFALPVASALKLRLSANLSQSSAARVSTTKPIAAPMMPPLASDFRPVAVNKSATFLKKPENVLALSSPGSSLMLPPKALAIAVRIPVPKPTAVLLKAPSIVCQNSPTTPPARCPIAAPTSEPGSPPTSMPIAPPSIEPSVAPKLACSAEPSLRPSAFSIAAQSLSVSREASASKP